MPKINSFSFLYYVFNFDGFVHPSKNFNFAGFFCSRDSQETPIRPHFKAYGVSDFRVVNSLPDNNATKHSILKHAFLHSGKEPCCTECWLVSVGLYVVV